MVSVEPETAGAAAPEPSNHLARALKFLLLALALIAIGYWLMAYRFVPSAWAFVERRHPALDMAGTRSFSVDGIPADPLNLAFVGVEEDVQRRMVQAGWYPADPITLKSALRIAVASAAHQAYVAAPVSNLFVNGRKQDLAFEQPAARDPSRRHHVRFWKMDRADSLGRPLWMAAATYDASVGLSHTTGQVTHHIAADVDAERDKLVADLLRPNQLALTWVEDFQPAPQGRNGGGDPFHTDRRLAFLAPPDLLQSLAKSFGLSSASNPDARR